MEELGRVALVFGGTALLLYRFAIRTTPGRGVMRFFEKAAYGVIVLYACNLALSLLGVRVAQNPLTVLSAGLLSVPGVAACALWAGLP